jgi:hypothetical protein
VVTDLGTEYLSGFPLLVRIEVRNAGDAPVTFGDLAQRPWLVRFRLVGQGRTSERYTTPPATDAGATWTIPPRGSRSVVLEVPSGGSLPAGDWTLGVTVQDAGGPVEIPARAIRIVKAEPSAGTPIWEPQVHESTGSLVPWVHRAAAGPEVWLARFEPRGMRLISQVRLAAQGRAAAPLAAHVRVSASRNRDIYWQSGPRELTIQRLEDGAARTGPRRVGLPWPKAEPLARGGDDRSGTLHVPLWVPAPRGESGSVKVLSVTERGAISSHAVVDLAARPITVDTALDAGENLLLALGHAAGIDLYRVDSTRPADLPAFGKRVVAATDGWRPSTIRFCTFEDRPPHAGGLGLLALLARPAEKGAEYRSIRASIAPTVLEDSGPRPWLAPGVPVDVLALGWRPFHVLSQLDGKLWATAEASAPTPAGAGTTGALWASGGQLHLATMAPGTVVADRILKPLPP